MYLNCHTYFSFRYGTLSVDELVAEAADQGIDTLALTDIHSTSAALEFVKACQEYKEQHNVEIRPVVGIEFRHTPDKLSYLGLARSNAGFRELCAFLTEHNLAHAAVPELAPAFEEVYVVYPLGAKPLEELRENEYIGIRAQELRKLKPAEAEALLPKLVMLHPVTYKGKDGYHLHRLLRAMDKCKLVGTLEPHEIAGKEECMLPPQELLPPFLGHYRIIQNTIDLLKSCQFTFEFHEPKNRKTFTGSVAEDRQLLEKLALDGLEKRYGRGHREATIRLHREIEIIHAMDFCVYFLITWDIIRYAQYRGFRHVGRGSGANSLVAFCLRITDVDPIELDLYFERFLNPHRSSPPDFDIDFSWQDRDEITDYIFKRYGKERTALLGAYSRYQPRLAIREVGKALGLSKNEIEAILAGRHEAADAAKDKVQRLVRTYAEKLIGFPHHLTIHAGGVLITEEPISNYTALDLPPKGLPVTHFDMFTAEDAGLYKYDILSQRGLGHIKDAVDLVAQNQGKHIDIDDVKPFMTDPVVRERIRTGDTIGCFYIESPAMRQLLRKLHCSDYLTLVAASSIIRPGVAKSGMMKAYITHYNNPASVKYLHPKMEELLQETYGVMVYQEDVIKVAHHFAGLGLAESDILRRGMSGKYRSRKEFDSIAEKFRHNCREKGYLDALTEEVWRQIESFSGYSFSKAHSASFAIESYQSLYLKAHFPLEFIVAVINNFGGFYSTDFYVQEARHAGATIVPPCVNTGQHLTSISGTTICMGFVHVKGLEHAVVKQLLHERTMNGAYQGLTDFLERVPLGLEQLCLLIRVGAFRFTGKSKKVLLCEAATLLSRGRQTETSTAAGTACLFKPEAAATPEFTFPELASGPYDDAYDEMELLGFPLCHPFEILDYPTLPQTQTAEDLLQHVGKKVEIVGYLVSIKYVRTVRKEIMHFGMFLDRAGHTFDTLHWPEQSVQYPFRGAGFYLLKGSVTEEFGHASIEVEYMEKLNLKKNERAEVTVELLLRTAV